MDFKKLNSQRITKTTNSPPPQAKPRGMTSYQKEVTWKNINELHEKVSNAQETATRLERELPKAWKEVELAQAGVAKTATSSTRGRLSRARDKLTEKQLAINGTEASIQAWEEQIAQKKKVLVDDRRLNGERSASGTSAPVQRAKYEVSTAHVLKTAVLKITRRKVKVPVGPSMEQMAERQAEEIVRHRAVRERDLQESKDAAAAECALKASNQQGSAEHASVAQMTGGLETTPSCSKRKGEDEEHGIQKKPKLDGNEFGSSETSEGSETSEQVKARKDAYDSPTAESRRASGKMYVYHPKRRTYDWHSIDEDDNILELAQSRHPSSSRANISAAAPVIDPSTPARERDGENDYRLHGLVNTKLSCFSNGVLQMLGAALSYEQIEKLRGDDDLLTFGLKHDDFLMLKTDADGKMRKPDRENLELLRSRISIHAVKNGEIDIAPYLGQVLLDMREGTSHKSKMPKSKHVANACLMQQVFAYGTQDGLRSEYDGDSQQDARLYFGALVDAVAGQHEFIRDIFYFLTSIQLECNKCAHQTEHIETDVFLDAALPAEETSDGEINIEDLPDIRRPSTERLLDHKCEGCGELAATSKTTTIQQLPRYWLVHLKRARPDDKKIKSKIGLAYDGTLIQAGQARYSLRCVLRHTGRSSSRGHYDVVREHQGKWFVIDEQTITGAKEADIKDNSRRQSAMVLLKKVEV